VPKKRVHVVNVRLNDAELAFLDRIAARKGLTRSGVMRTAFLEHPLTILEIKKAKKISGQELGR
jgi:hypothetical protein